LPSVEIAAFAEQPGYVQRSTFSIHPSAFGCGLASLQENCENAYERTKSAMMKLAMLSGRQYRISDTQLFLPLTVLLAFAACQVATAAEMGRLVVNIFETQTSRPIACNVYLTANGKALFAPGCPRWERDGSFACDGQFAVEAPEGKVEMTVERGPEWESCARTLECKAGTTTTLPLRQISAQEALTKIVGAPPARR